MSPLSLGALLVPLLAGAEPADRELRELDCPALQALIDSPRTSEERSGRAREEWLSRCASGPGAPARRGAGPAEEQAPAVGEEGAARVGGALTRLAGSFGTMDRSAGAMPFSGARTQAASRGPEAAGRAPAAAAPPPAPSGSRRAAEQAARAAAVPAASSAYSRTVRTAAPPAPSSASPAAAAAAASAPPPAVAAGFVLPPGGQRGPREPRPWGERLKNAVTSPLSDAYGITIRARNETGAVEEIAFRDPVEGDRWIRALPGPAIVEIIFYGHGAPGVITVGSSYSLYAGEAAGLLRGKTAPGATVMFLGCNTASIGGASVNPASGLSHLARRVMYFSVPVIGERLSGGDPERARETWEREWDRDLAQETSRELPGARVCGLRTFGLVGDRLPVVAQLLDRHDATSSRWVAGSEVCYLNGRKVD